MIHEPFQLAYASDNADQADVLIRKFADFDVYPGQIVCQDSDQPGHFSQALRSATTPVVLLVSDNFLKSLQCLYETLESARGLQDEDRLVVVVIDGVEIKEYGQASPVPTRLDSLSNIISYMNYWQQAYLDIRSQKREVKSVDQKEYEQKTLEVRSVSSEIGEFLRFLREFPSLSLEEFSEQGFRQFFRFLGLQEPIAARSNGASKSRTAAQSGAAAVPTPVVDSTPELPTHTHDECDDAPQEVKTHHPEPQIETQVDSLPESTLAADPEPRVLTEDSYASSDAVEFGTRPQEDSIFGDFGAVYVPDDSPVPQPIKEAIHDAESADDEDEIDDEGEGLGGNVHLQDEEEDDLEFETLWPETEDDSEIRPRLSAERRANDLEQRAEPADERIAHIAQSAFFFAQTGEVEQGLSVLRALLKKHPLNVFVRYRLATFLLKHTDHEEEAQQQLETILTYDPAYASASIRLAEIAERKGDHLLARHYLEKARDADPEYPEIHYRLGLLTQLHFPDNRDEILECFRLAVQADSENVDANYRYAVLLSDIHGNEYKAIRYFKRTLELQPDHPFANYDLALIYHRLRNWDQAAHYYRLAAQVNPEVKTDKNDHAFFGPLEQKSEEERKQTAAFPIRNAGQRGKVAWITGATSGIGKATAEVFAQAGYRLILTGRRTERLDAFKRHLEEIWQTECLTFAHDVRDMEALRKAVESLEDHWKNIDVLVNNAGLAKGLAPVHEADVTHWETMIDTNIKGLLYMTRLIAPLMVSRGEGHIINVCSVAGKEVYPNGNVYCATKHAVDALTRAMRLDLHSHGIRVSQVSPGHVEETEFALVRFDGDAEQASIYGDFKPLASADVAETIFFIATRPAHVTIQDVLMFGSQQASANHIHRSGRPE